MGALKRTDSESVAEEFLQIPVSAEVIAMDASRRSDSLSVGLEGWDGLDHQTWQIELSWDEVRGLYETISLHARSWPRSHRGKWLRNPTDRFKIGRARRIEQMRIRRILNAPDKDGQAV